MDAQGSSTETPAIAEPAPLYNPPPHNGNSRSRGTPCGRRAYGGQRLLLWLCLTYRVVVACLGRRWGKTRACMMLILEEAARKSGQYLAGYATPTARLARRRYDEFLELFTLAGFDVTSNRQDLVLTIKNRINGCSGITLFFWGLDEPENIRGEALDRLIIDECKDVVARAYYSVLRPMLIDTGGRVLLMGTPSRVGKGAAWYRREYVAAQKGEEGRAWMNGPTHDNPVLTLENIEEAIRDVEREGKSVDEEIFAKWREGEGAVFSNLDAVFDVQVVKTFRCAADGSFVPEEEPGKINLWIGEPADVGDDLRQPDDYAGAIDLAKAPEGDSTVMHLLNQRTRRHAACLKMRGILYMDQLPHAAALVKQYGGARTSVLYDATGGHGSALTEPLARLYGEGIRGRTWGPAAKATDITHAQNLCAQAGKDEAKGFSWRLMNIPWLRSEFEEYQVQTMTKEGTSLIHPHYGAPPGQHDDGVSAAILAAPLVNRPYLPRQRIKPPPKVGSASWLDQENEGDVYLLR